MRRPLILITCVFLTGCAAASASVINAATNVAVAGAVGAVRRSQGKCATECNPGYTCNEATGFCDRLPCDGTCPALTHCVVEGPKETCVADGPPGPANPPSSNLLPK